jgi:uncharacterized delta-60 repeat protein
LVFDYQAEDNYFACVLQLSNGKILIGGNSSGNFVFSLLSESGIFDSLLGNNNAIEYDFPGNGSSGIFSIKEVENEKFVVAGVDVVGTNRYATLSRFNSDLTIDNSFASNGNYVTAFSSNGYSSGLEVLSDGKIVMGCTKFILGNFLDFAVLQFNADGTLDTNFGENGSIYINITGGNLADSFSDLSVQNDGKIILCGHTNIGNSTYVFSVARLNTNGSLDESFGIGGKATFPSGLSSDVAVSIISRASNKMVIGGQMQVANMQDYKLLFLNSDGSIDTNFGTTGSVIIDNSGNDFLHKLAQQSDGKILATGRTGPLTGTHFMTARINVEDNLGIQQLDEMKFKMFPNPTTNKVYITSQKPDSISITNILGANIVLPIEYSGEQLIIDFSGVTNNGIYLITIIVEGCKKSLKVVKQ